MEINGRKVPFLASPTFTPAESALLDKAKASMKQSRSITEDMVEPLQKASIRGTLA